MAYSAYLFVALRISSLRMALPTIGLFLPHWSLNEEIPYSWMSRKHFLSSCSSSDNFSFCHIDTESQTVQWGNTKTKQDETQILGLGVWCQYAPGLQLISVLLISTYCSLSLSGWFNSQSETFFVRYPMTLAFPASWSPQHNPAFAITASHNGLSGPQCKDTSDTWLASVAFFSWGGIFHHPFLLSLTLKLEPCD